MKGETQNIEECMFICLDSKKEPSKELGIWGVCNTPYHLIYQSYKGSSAPTVFSWSD